MDMNFSKFWEIVEDRGAWHDAVHAVTKSWTINKVEHQGIDAFFTVVLEKTYESSLVFKEIKSVNHKGNQS